MRWPWQRRVLTRAELGALGERHAARLLRAQGLTLIEANFRAKQGELDIIARDQGTIVFVEVRTRTSEEMKTPLASVDERKQAKIINMAHQYNLVRRIPETMPWRFDVVEVIASPDGRIRDIRHVPGAFTA